MPDDSRLNNMFLPYYETGKTVTIEFPDGKVVSGRVGVSQGDPKEFVLVTRGKGSLNCYPLTLGCNILPTYRKNSMRTPGYLSGKVPTFQEVH